MCSRALHVTATTISFAKIIISILMPKLIDYVLCEYCNESCEQYHLPECTVKKVSLREDAKIFKKWHIFVLY
jgi:hypothetical protein